MLIKILVVVVFASVFSLFIADLITLIISIWREK